MGPAVYQATWQGRGVQGAEHQSQADLPQGVGADEAAGAAAREDEGGGLRAYGPSAWDLLAVPQNRRSGGVGRRGLGCCAAVRGKVPEDVWPVVRVEQHDGTLAVLICAGGVP